MRILVACNSFKDALPASAVCVAIAAGLRRRREALEITEFPLADGGDGTLAVLTQHLSLKLVYIDAVDPLFRSISAPIGISHDGELAVIEMATASGIQLLNPNERNALLTTTLGTGKLIVAAIDYGVKRILLGIGGSATHDVGIGIASALGWRFLDDKDREVRPIGKSLGSIERIAVPPHRTSIPIDVLCDVTNPLLGTYGAAHIYARQKGASAADIAALERGSKHFAARVQQNVIAMNPDTPGSGAAGGLGYGAMAFLNASLRRGVDTLLELTSFDRALAETDIVITGEGRLDAQTTHGKLIAGICERAQRAGIPVIALAGEIDASTEQLNTLGLREAVCINQATTDRAGMLSQTASNLTMTAATLKLPRR